MPSITDLMRRFDRRPLAKPNATYYLWRFAANGLRTRRALMTPTVFTDTPAIARELTEQGIVVVAPSNRFLSDDGHDAPLVDRAVRLKGKPLWISSAIQRYALKQMDIAPASDGNKKNSRRCS
jgi:hypothetical protein